MIRGIRSRRLEYPVEKPEPSGSINPACKHESAGYNESDHSAFI